MICGHKAHTWFFIYDVKHTTQMSKKLSGAVEKYNNKADEKNALKEH